MYSVIRHHAYSDELSQKVYITGSVCEIPSIVWTSLIVHSKFGVSLLFDSGINVRIAPPPGKWLMLAYCLSFYVIVHSCT